MEETQKIDRFATARETKARNKALKEQALVDKDNEIKILREEGVALVNQIEKLKLYIKTMEAADSNQQNTAPNITKEDNTTLLNDILFVEGMKLAMTNFQVKHPADVAKCVPVAMEFKRVCNDNRNR